MLSNVFRQANLIQPPAERFFFGSSLGEILQKADRRLRNGRIYGWDESELLSLIYAMQESGPMAAILEYPATSYLTAF